MTLGAGVERQNRRVVVRGHLRPVLFYGVLAVVLVVGSIGGLVIGSTDLAWTTVARVLALKVLPPGWIDASAVTGADEAIVWLIRLPRLIVAVVVGAGLATAGAMMQGLFRNPLAEPNLTGAGAGAVLGAVVVFVTGLSASSVVLLPMAAIVAALAALGLVYALATRGGVTPVATLLLAGIAVGSILNAVSSLIISFNIVSWQVAQEVLFWMMGGLDSRTWAHVWLSLPFVAVGLVSACLQARTLDLMLLGEEGAASLGVDVESAKRLLVATSALLTGACVAVAGMVGFVGLIVPHAVRLALGPGHRKLIPATAVSGAAFLVVCDLVARTVYRPVEIRLGVVTALCGAPFFLALLIGRLREARD